MASHLIGTHQQTSFAAPVNGDAGDATVVLANDNATVTSYNAHDIDPTIHVQDSTAAVFAATPAGTAGRKWMTSDAGAVYLYYDTGSVWVEANYLRATTGTLTASAPSSIVQTWNNGAVTFTALLINITNTASAAASKLVDVQLSGSTYFAISAAGNTGIGGGANAGVCLSVNTGGITGTDQRGVNVTPTFTAAATAQGTGVVIAPATAASAFTMTSYTAVSVADISLGAGSAVTTQYGIKIASLTSGGTNYAIFTGAGLISLGDLTTITSTTANQLTVAYDGTHKATLSVSNAGLLTVNATSTVTITPATTITGALTLSSTLTVAGIISNATGLASGFSLGADASVRRLSYGSDGANTFSFLTAGNGYAGLFIADLHSTTILASALGSFASGDKYVIVDSSGNFHKSALGPAS